MRDIRAVVFDMDGLLIDSEPMWQQARRAFCASQGCTWTEEDEQAAKGMNSPEWAALIKHRCGFSMGLDEIIAGVRQQMLDLYAQHLPLLPGATETVRELARSYPLGVASSSPPELIDFVLQTAGIRDAFRTVVSSDTAGRGKPAPDVYLMCAERLGAPALNCAAFEDSSAGITSAHGAGMAVIAVPNPHNPPTGEALGLASLVLPSLTAFRPEMLRGL